MGVVDDSLFRDTEESLRRLVLLLYALVTPIFLVVLGFLLKGNLYPVAVVLGLCALGFVWTLLVPNQWEWKWVVPGAFVPIASCAIALVWLGPAGLVFMAALTAPLAWSSILFNLKTVISSFVLSALACLWTVTLNSGLASAVVATLGFATVQFLVAWVIYGKRYGMTLARLESLERQLNDAEFTMDTNGNLTYANSNALAFYGYSDEEMLHLNIADLRAPVSQKDFAAQFGQVHEKHTILFETVHRRKDGTEFPVEVSSRIFWFQGKEFVHSVIRDLTERRRAEAERLRSQKMESVGSLAAGIAHDFNNLLAGLNGQIELLSLFLLSGKTKDATDRLQKFPPLIARAKSLTSRLTTFTKGGSPVLSLVVLGPYLEDWVALALVGSSLAAKVEIAPDLWNCVCDKDQVSQVIHNLVLNAREASPPGATVRVRAENRVANGSFVALAVSDSGTGIPPDTLDRIFDPFFTTKANGSGLGLSVSYSIAKQHGGRIDVQTEVGKGSTFTLFLPASFEAVKASAPVESFESLKFSGVAVVMDDIPDVRESVGEMLSQHGFELLLAKDGEEALQHGRHLRESGKKVDLYVLDLTIPGGLGGLATAERLRSSDKEVAIVFMSGYSDDVLKLTAQKFLPSGWLSKPFTNVELGKTLSALDGLPRAQ